MASVMSSAGSGLLLSSHTERLSGLQDWTPLLHLLHCCEDSKYLVATQYCLTSSTLHSVIKSGSSYTWKDVMLYAVPAHLNRQVAVLHK